jgi:two-component system sensor histidine kinase UhpB
MEVLFGITCAVELPAELPALTEEQVLHLSRIAQEAARNAVQHAGAKLVEITVALRAGQLELAIRSTGRAWSGAEPSDKSLGLRLMTYRVSILGGTLAVRQELDGKTAVICTIPLAESSRPASVPGAALDPKPHEQDACIGR